MKRPGEPEGCRVSGRRGVTLIETLIALSIVSVALTVSVWGFRQYAEKVQLRAAAAVVRSSLAYAKMAATAQRQTVSLELTPGGQLRVRTRAGVQIRTVQLLGAGGFALDSARLRPRSLRFNSRGHAGPGSVYLFRGADGIRLVVNFIGRVREERVRSAP